MYVVEGLNGLQFDHHTAFDQEIEAMFADRFASIRDGNSLLAFITDTDVFKFRGEGLLVYRLKKSGISALWTVIAAPMIRSVISLSASIRYS